MADQQAAKCESSPQVEFQSMAHLEPFWTKVITDAWADDAFAQELAKHPKTALKDRYPNDPLLPEALKEAGRFQSMNAYSVASCGMPPTGSAAADVKDLLRGSHHNQNDTFLYPPTCC